MKKLLAAMAVAIMSAGWGGTVVTGLGTDAAANRAAIQKAVDAANAVGGGFKGIRPYDPKGERRAELKPLATDDRVFFPVAELPSRRFLPSILLGESYNTDIEDVVACIRRAGARKETLVFASHGIHPNAHGIHLKAEWLERILAAAQEAGVAVLGYDEVPLR